MDIAILILSIIGVLLLGILTFFIFQIWVHSKEAKIEIKNTFQEIQKGFAQFDHSQKSLNLNLIESIISQNKIVISAVELLKKQVEELEDQLSKSTNLLDKSLEIKFTYSEKYISTNIDELKLKVAGVAAELHQVTKNYSELLKNEQISYLEKFELAVNSIETKQKELYRAITEPLKINMVQG